MSLIDFFRQSSERAPAFYGLLSFFWGAFLYFQGGNSLVFVAFCLLILVALFRYRKYWWLSFLFFLGVAWQVREDHREQYWNDFFQHSGFAELEFRWIEDAVLPGRDGDIRARALVWPKGQSSLSSVFWTGVREPEAVNKNLLYAGAKFSAKVAVGGEGRRYGLSVSGPSMKPQGHSPFFSFRAWVIERLAVGWEESGELLAGWSRSVVTSNRRGLGDAESAAFHRLGLLHLLALSGLHVYLLFGFLRLLAYKWPVGFRDSLAFGGVCIYALLGGLGFSLLRATVMCGGAVWAPLSGRRYRSVNMLLALALFELLLRPRAWHSLSFQLSYAGVAGVLFALSLIRYSGLLSLRRTVRWPGWLLRLAQGYLISWGAMLFTWPIAAHHISTYPLLSWLLSPMVVALFTPVLFLSLLAQPFCFFGMAIPSLVAYPIELFLTVLRHLSEAGSWIGSGPTGDPGWLILYYGGLIGIWVLSEKYAERKT